MIFTLSFYIFLLYLRCLDLFGSQFLSNILIPFPDLIVFYHHVVHPYCWVFLELVQFAFSKLWIVLEINVKLQWQSHIFWKKLWFSKAIKKFVVVFFLHLIYNESLYYVLCSCANLISQKKLFLRYGPKCSQPIRLQDFKSNCISRKKWWNSLSLHDDTDFEDLMLMWKLLDRCGRR